LVLPSIFKYDVEERINLINTIMGRKPADIVISNVNIVLTTTGEILEDANIVISGKRIAGMGKINELHRFVGRETIVIDGENNYVLPGFIDPHVHIESSLLTPRGFAKLALRHGTTTIVADPHEIGNVLGSKGVELFVEASKNLPLKILIDIPSCVPATDPSFGLETTANIIGIDEIEKLAMLEGTIGLGEVMDYVSVLNASKYVLEKIRIANKYGLIINGHAPLLQGEKLDAYIDAGIWSDHESTTLEEAIEKIRKGMYVFIREGSAWKDLKALSPLLKNNSIDLRLCSFASDDINVVDLMEKGHMDRIINIAIEYGIDPIKAIQLATIGPAIRLHLEDHIGIIGPARLADIVFTKSIEYIEPHTVIANGEIIYYKGELKKPLPEYNYPKYALNTVNIGKIPKPEDLLVKVNVKRGIVRANIIQVIPGSAITKRVVEELVVENGVVLPDPSRDIILATVIDRHKATGSIGKGFIKGLGFRAGAIAQTIAHDTHNLIVAGSNPEDMVEAIKWINNNQGGIVVVDNGEVLAGIPLRLAGLMSTEEPEKVYEEYKNLTNILMKKYGLEFEAFFMTLGLVALPVIPEIRLTDKGLVDVNKAKIIPLIVDEESG